MKCLKIKQNGIRKRAPLVKSICISVKLLIQAGMTKDFIITAVWMCMGAFISFTAVFHKNFLNAVADLIVHKEHALKSAIFWLVVWGGAEITVNVVNAFCTKTNIRLWTKVEVFIQEKVVHKITKIKEASSECVSR